MRILFLQLDIFPCAVASIYIHRLENSRASVSLSVAIDTIMFHNPRNISPDAYVNMKQTQYRSRILIGEGKADVKEELHCTFNVQ